MRRLFYERKSQSISKFLDGSTKRDPDDMGVVPQKPKFVSDPHMNCNQSSVLDSTQWQPSLSGKD